ncbi:RagB/SusD family nutrient uptake outer membrane protein [Chitinophaga arvensicola]|uniref:Starch-binding associating with outer membrane n=1 Tax=Chitinophaga arvensicola TaxID=29529 RepID=A0A1I0S9V4_9BACT|nr:RagB/SusD family nutrient uptake outer membrane protein [Chitinophaga arvensicola]SEW52983.1 Starch-binding associating with outer membrane [Chitinophaga arvensicola]
MNRKIICLLALLLALGQNGCKKFLDVKPLDKLSGNAFLQDKKDIESNLWDTYGLLRDKLGSCPFLPNAGDIRSGMMAESPEEAGRNYVHFVSQNDLATFIALRGNDGLYHWGELTRWQGFYKVIQASNNLFYEVGRRDFKDVSETERKRYRAEAVFLRCIAYWIMIRVWGDVPYYTDPYHSDPLPREKMTIVAKGCLDDLAKVKDDLPWQYSDPAYVGVRATKGALLTLMMELDMWNAGFDKANARSYYQQAADMGTELVSSKQYDLLLLSDYRKLFQGRTKESLFEIAQNANYNEIIMYNTFSDLVLHYPYKRPVATHQHSYSYYRADFLRRLFPTGQPDARVQYWFDENMFADNGDFQYLKFVNVYAINDKEDYNPDGNVILFRYADGILLLAEALAELNRDKEAMDNLNLIRNRALANPYNGPGGQPLKDEIFAERARELMGEGHYYFDLVRTGRIFNSQWCYYPLTQLQFNMGGWTWPLDPVVQNQNPLIQLNTYWTN